MLLCPVCCDEEADIISSSDASTTAPATAAQVVRTTQEVRDNARAAYERLQAAQAMSFTADAEEEEDHLILFSVKENEVARGNFERKSD